MRLPSQLDRQCRRRLRARSARYAACPLPSAKREFRVKPPRACARGAEWCAAPHWQEAPAQCGPSAFLKLRSLSERGRSEEHTSELQSLMRISYAVFCLKKKITY